MFFESCNELNINKYKCFLILSATINNNKENFPQLSLYRIHFNSKKENIDLTIDKKRKIILFLRDCLSFHLNPCFNLCFMSYILCFYVTHSLRKSAHSFINFFHILLSIRYNLQPLEMYVIISHVSPINFLNKYTPDIIKE